jgi:hypothetical protein
MRFEAGQRWLHPTRGVFRVMAVAEGWAFGRYPQCIPFAISFAELAKEFTLHSPAPPPRKVAQEKSA